MTPTPYQQACVHTAAELLKYVVEKQQEYPEGTPEHHVYGQAGHLLGAFFRIIADQQYRILQQEEH